MTICTILVLVADDDLACKDLLIGLPFLQHLRIDSIGLLSNNHTTRDGTDCAEAGNPPVERMGRVGRLMMTRRMSINENSYKHRVGYN